MPDPQLQQDLRAVARLKIYFGHQSVGQNLIDGLKELALRNDVPALRFVSADSLPDGGEAYFADSRIGENHKPDLKCAAFSAQMSALLKQAPPDVAFMKFCYSDIDRDSDVQAVFDRYRATIDSLKAAAPHVRLAHFTVPLTVGTSSLRKMLFSLLGRQGTADLSNVRRNEFNALLRDYYRDEQVFDIAEAQSTDPEGRAVTFMVDGAPYRRMYDGYASDDGAHMNPEGSRFVARRLSRFLALVR
ncbi:MAG TPA: hypothetical protein VF889_01175 [Bacteroidota bacterium]